MITISLQCSQDAAQIEKLLDDVFGTDRHTKASYSVRSGVTAIAELSFVARIENRVVGTVRFWPVQVQVRNSRAVTQALLLGPLAIDPMVQGCKLGSKLMEVALSTAKAHKAGPILLVGAESYYSRFGFMRLSDHRLALTGGFDADRILVLAGHALASLPKDGIIEPMPSPKRTMAA